MAWQACGAMRWLRAEGCTAPHWRSGAAHQLIPVVQFPPPLICASAPSWCGGRCIYSRGDPVEQKQPLIMGLRCRRGTGNGVRSKNSNELNWPTSSLPTRTTHVGHFKCCSAVIRPFASWFNHGALQSCTSSSHLCPTCAGSGSTHSPCCSDWASPPTQRTSFVPVLHLNTTA